MAIRLLCLLAGPDTHPLLSGVTVLTVQPMYDGPTRVEVLTPATMLNTVWCAHLSNPPMIFTSDSDPNIAPPPPQHQAEGGPHHLAGAHVHLLELPVRPLRARVRTAVTEALPS